MQGGKYIENNFYGDSGKLIDQKPELPHGVNGAYFCHSPGSRDARDPGNVI